MDGHFMTIVMLLVTGLGFCFLMMGLFMIDGYYQKKKNCSQKVTAKVERNEARTSQKKNTAKGMAKNMAKGAKTGRRKIDANVRYYPVFLFMAGRKRIEIKSQVGAGKPRYQEGDEVTLYYSPEDPQEYYIEGDKSVPQIGWACILIGLAVGLLGLNLKYHFLF